MDEATSATPQERGSTTTYLCGVNVIDATKGDVVPRATIVVADGRIAQVARSIPASQRDGTVVDLDGAYAVPGLWNVHTHLGGMFPDNNRQEHHESAADRTIRAGSNLLTAFVRGITGVRVVGDAAGVDIAWRNAIRRGEVRGPNLFVCGCPIIPTGGHGHDIPGVIQADGPSGFRTAVRSQLALGVDQIKLMITGGVATVGESMDEAQALSDEIEAAVAVAHRKGKRVTVHAGGAGSIKEAILAGVDCVEHGYRLDEEAVDLMVKHGVYFVPTMFVTQYERFMIESGMPPHAVAKAKGGAAAHLQGFRMALDAGVKIAAGADSNPIRENSFVEVEMLVQSGMQPLDAIRAATATAADLCGVGDEVGTIEPGKRADVLVVHDNPLDRISNLRNRCLVICGGHVVADPERRVPTESACSAFGVGFERKN
jgi:imidazolonepropionase-like amidohydrolase